MHDRALAYTARATSALLGSLVEHETVFITLAQGSVEHCTGINRLFAYCTCIVRPANRDWACQTERCHKLSNKTSLQ